MKFEFDFKGQTVLITGATRGIGKAAAEQFFQLGASLVLTGTKQEQVNALNRGRKNQARIEYHCVDFSDRESTERFLKDIGRLKRIDVCINNAGINRINDIDQGLLADLDDMMNVNLKAPYLLIRQVSKVMKRQKYGRIVNVGSIFSQISRPKRSMYSMTKFGLHGITVAAANELAQHNVLINTLSPGFVLTDLTKKNLSRVERAELKRGIPMGRFARPEEIAKLIVFLASSQNTYLTGQNIIADGGYVNV